MGKLKNIINGTILSDANIRVREGKYFYYQYTGKDEKFLLWLRKMLRKHGITNSYICISNRLSRIFVLGFYMNKHNTLLKLREKWYNVTMGKTIKTVPRDLKLTPTVLLFWYLGDGSLPRRNNDENRIPPVVLATNCFTEKDVDLLIEKLKELNLNFYKVKCKSGFKKGKECGFVLYSKQDGTPFRFFKLIGFKPPKEIANCVTGKKGPGSKLHFIKDKWPTEEDWIKILSDVKEVGRILRKRRMELGLSQSQLAKKVGVSREGIRDVELGKRCFSVKNFKKILNVLGLRTFTILKLLN